MGQLVQYAGSPGVGRVGEVDDSRARVEFFESVAEPLAHSEWVPLVDCDPLILSPGTRVYWRNRDTGDWLAGRVKALVDDSYFVAFPNVPYDFPVPVDELRVRWDQPIADPVTVLTAGGNESAYFHDARLPFLRNLVAQRAASANTSALLSSAVELFPHQIHTVLTVLSDPVQRYLLADEVGLGKGIEAGLIIRQTLLDYPTAQICVVTPEVLRRQWVQELCDKFFIDDFPRATVKCLAHETPERWANYHQSDLVIVDEVHRLAQTAGPDDPSYRALAALAHSSPRLLLLSATPVMSHQATQLGVLHLLDPELYRWTDRAAFEHKYKLRSQLASSVHALDSDYTYLLPSAIEHIRALLPSADYRFAELSRRILELLDDEDELLPNADTAELKVRTEALRAHISEAYRLHRRVIRHRRRTVLRDDPESDCLPFEVRGRQDPEVLVIDSDAHNAVQVALSEWRSRVWDHLIDADLERYKASYAMAFAVLVSRGTVSPGDLAAALEWRINNDEKAAHRAGLDDRERTLLLEPTVLDVERAVLEELRARLLSAGPEQRHLDDLIDTMLPALKRSRRTVIFCGPGQLAGALTERLRQRFKQLSVHEHSRHVDPEAAAKAVSTWAVPLRQYAGNRVLVADDSAEDGLNLQMADATIHLRLPWSPNQLEQRLGRVDRYQAAGQLTSLAPALQYRLGDHDAEESFLEAWAVLMSAGFHVFSESVSTLQDAIFEGLVEIWTSALEHGPEGLHNVILTVRKKLELAREEIDKMDMLEAVHETSLENRDLAGALIGIEADWRDIQAAMLRYASGPGGINLRHQSHIVDGCKREVFDLWRSRPLLDPRQWNQAQARVYPKMAEGAFNRSAALKARGTRLLRLGNPLVDVLAAALFGDDRGQASAFRRSDPDHRGDALAYFGFDYLVEADLTGALDLLADQRNATSALRRQADRLLPPFTLKVWIEGGAESPVTDTLLLNWLERPYDNKRDQNYSSGRISGLLEVFGDWGGYRAAAEAAELSARQHLAEVTDLARRCDQAQEHSRQRVAIAMAQAQARKAAGHLVGDTESLITDATVADALVKGLSQPTVKVIAATCVIRTRPEVVSRDK
ncbi:restriction endonuclease subunit R [Microbispora triticiradicis]|uniref:Restriction endonuclease subunit R n=1 Tax=Microbispora triticiradicis TaxID=2200763 RepID=A0ABX9LK87_9ACTN|nr:restriction endonuclease subunit R [Microbispora triticiradicis]